MSLRTSMSYMARTFTLGFAVSLIKVIGLTAWLVQELLNSISLLS